MSQLLSDVLQTLTSDFLGIIFLASKQTRGSQRKDLPGPGGFVFLPGVVNTYISGKE